MIYGENVMLVQTIRTNGVKSSKLDELHAGHSIEVHTDENRHPVEKLILSDHSATVTELETATG